MKLVSTSRPELMVYYFVKKEFPDALSRHRIIDDNGNILEVDVYIPEINTAIEYDGSYWHKDRFDGDVLKTELLNNAGVTVVRIRDVGLPELPQFKGLQLWHRGKRAKTGMHTNEYLTAMFHFLSGLCSDNEKKKHLSDYNLTYEEYKTFLPDINAMFYDEPAEDSVSTREEFKYWDYEKNGSLKPENLPKKAGIKVYIKCPSGESKYVNASSVAMFGTGKRKHNEMLIDICPLIWNSFVCEVRCDYFYDKLKASLEELIKKDHIQQPELPSKDAGVFYEFHRYIGENESLIYYYLGRLLEDSIPIERFKLLFMPGGKFCSYGVNYLIITKKETFERLKTAQHSFDWFDQYIWFDSSKCDSDDGSRKAMYDYLEWRIKDWEPRQRGLYIESCLWPGVNRNDVSEEFKTGLRKLVEKYPSEFSLEVFEKKAFGDQENEGPLE